MGLVAERLAAAGLVLPEVAAPIGAYVPAVRAGNLVFTSGQLPFVDGVLLASGRVGENVTIEAAQACAERSTLNALTAAAMVCDLDDVVQVVKVVGFVASASDFSAHPSVINGASELLALAFGDPGRHAREAVGVSSLPMGSPVEVSLVLLVG
jgi:enamine deaminase RidA (YjgF/YER057c/UK114 family)